MEYLDINQIDFIPINCYTSSNTQSNLPEIYRSVMVYYEIDFITHGTAKFSEDGFSYILKPGDISFRRPGQQHTMSKKYLYECEYLYFHIIKKDTGEIIDNSPDYVHFLSELPNHIHTERPEEIAEIFSRIRNNFFYGSEQNRLIVKSMIMYLMSKIYALGMKQQNKSVCIYHPAVEKSIKYIQNNLSSDISISKLAEHAGISTKYFHNLFKTTIGKTPACFITEQRLIMARKLLMATNISIDEIAFSCGFSSSSYFISVFKQSFGKTPLKFRNESV